MPESFNNWDVKFSTIKFFERLLEAHQKVASFTREGDILFKIRRTNGFSPVNALLVNRYTIGLADVIQAKGEFPELTCIVANGNWCGYTKEAKQHGKSNGIGVFIISEISGALLSRNANGYTRKDSNGKPVYSYRSA